MNSSTQFAPMIRTHAYESIHQPIWETYKDDFSSIGSTPTIVAHADIRVDNKAKDTSYEQIIPLENSQEEVRTPDKIQRRLAQNREAARKSRLRKKAYVQQLESCRLKLAKMEQELARTRQQAMYCTSQLGSSFAMNSGIAAFEIEYTLWVDEQRRKTCELRNALQTNLGDIELRMIVENCLNHYYKLFRIKADAAKSDAFYLHSGVWRTPVERYFHWLGGFRPSDLLNIVLPQLEPLMEQQQPLVSNLRQSSLQAEDALTQGMDRLQQTLAQSFLPNHTHDSVSYRFQTASAIEQLEALEGFLNQADHLRQQTLTQISRVLSVHQTARGLLALGEHFQRLQALSTLWASRPRDIA